MIPPRTGDAAAFRQELSHARLRVKRGGVGNDNRSRPLRRLSQAMERRANGVRGCSDRQVRRIAPHDLNAQSVGTGPRLSSRATAPRRCGNHRSMPFQDVSGMDRANSFGCETCRCGRHVPPDAPAPAICPFASSPEAEVSRVLMVARLMIVRVVPIKRCRSSMISRSRVAVGLQCRLRTEQHCPLQAGPTERNDQRAVQRIKRAMAA